MTPENRRALVCQVFGAPGYLDDLSVRFWFDILHVIDESPESVLIELNDPTLLEKWKGSKRPIGWRAEVLEKLKSSAFRGVISEKTREVSAFEKLGLVYGVMEENMELLQGIKEEDVEELEKALGLPESPNEAEDATGIPTISDLVFNLSRRLPSLQRSELCNGYARGLRFHRNEQGNLKFENTTTKVYFALLIFADIVDQLGSRSEVIELLRAGMGNELFHQDPELIKIFQRIKLMSQEKRGRPKSNRT